MSEWVLNAEAKDDEVITQHRSPIPEHLKEGKWADVVAEAADVSSCDGIYLDASRGREDHTAACSTTLLLHVAFTALGVASFMLCNSLWADMAALYRRLPEGNRLAAIMIVALQAANLVPLIVMTKGPHRQLLRLETGIWLLLVFGFIIAQLLSFFWARTARVGGAHHSVALFVLTFAVGSINNTSGLAMYPFVARFPRQYTTALATGEGLSGVLVATLAALQNAGGRDMRFSVSLYFQLVAWLYLFSFAAYAYLLRYESKGLSNARLRRYRCVVASSDAAPRYLGGNGVGSSRSLGVGASAGSLEQSLIDARVTGHGSHEPPRDASSPPLSPSSFSTSTEASSVLRLLWPILTVQLIISVLAYGLAPAILPVACTGYKHEAHILQYSSFVSMAADPLARALTHWVRCYRLGCLLLTVCMLACMLLASAAMSPAPPFSGLELGGVVFILIYGVFFGMFAFTSTMVYFSCRRVLAVSTKKPLGGALEREESLGAPNDEVSEGEEASPESLARWAVGYKWSAFAVQVGALLGSMMGFVVVYRKFSPIFNVARELPVEATMITRRTIRHNCNLPPSETYP